MSKDEAESRPDKPKPGKGSVKKSARLVKKSEAQVSEAIQLRHAVGHVAQKHRHVVVGIGPASPRARTERNDALESVAVNFSHGGAEVVKKWIVTCRGRYTRSIAHSCYSCPLW